VSSLPALTSLNLHGCGMVTDGGLRAVSNLHALTFLNLTSCGRVTDEGASCEQPACAHVSRAQRVPPRDE
jgi:hypothetical protein